MRKLLWLFLLGLALGFASPAMAQDDYPRVQAYVGYDLLHVTCCGGSATWNGASGEVSYNATHLLAVVADFAGYTKSMGGATVNFYTYQFGPRVYISRGKIQPFVQALFGGIHASASIGGGGAGSINGFNLDAGGGVDVGLSQHFAVRPVELAYEYSHFSPPGGGFHFNNLRYSGGIVFKF
jgi:hypothetical protein